MKFFSFWSTVGLHLILKEALFLRFLLITYLITLSLEKEIICLEKSLEKFLKFMKPWYTMIDIWVTV